MNSVSKPVHDIADRYQRDGFFLPYDVIGESEARTLRADLESAEAELRDRPDELSLLRSYPAQLLPGFAALIRHPALIDAVSQILGPDLMVWSSALFIKEANSPSFVSWHQDLTYWGLDETDEITAWVALSTSSEQTGCMRFIPGSHKQRLVPHTDSFAKDNLLTRGQELAVTVNDADAVNVLLKPGQASLHHGHLFHASGPNSSDDRRIGVAIRYIQPAMKQRTGDKTVVALVNGVDRYQHFRVAPPPTARLQETDLEVCRYDADIKARVLYQGAEQAAGKRYK